LTPHALDWPGPPQAGPLPGPAGHARRAAPIASDGLVGAVWHRVVRAVRPAAQRRRQGVRRLPGVLLRMRAALARPRRHRLGSPRETDTRATTNVYTQTRSSPPACGTGAPWPRCSDGSPTTCKAP